MDDINILPEELQGKSLSKREIVLNYQDAVKAVEVLCNNNWVVVGWEVWFRYPNGQVSHFFECEGISYIDTSDWEIDDNEEWDILVTNLAQRCKDEITKSYKYWCEKCTSSGIEPYYCITSTDSLRGRYE